MNSTLKNILATIAGLVAGGVIVALGEMVGSTLFPLPFELDFSDPESAMNTLALNMDQVPLGSQLAVIFSHLIGTLVGAWIAMKLSADSTVPAYTVIGLLLVATIMNLLQIPHPLWFDIADVAGVIIGGFIGIRLSGGKRPSSINPHMESGAN